MEFNPIRATDVKLPDGVAFVIANSLVSYIKPFFVYSFCIKVLSLPCNLMPFGIFLNEMNLEKTLKALQRTNEQLCLHTAILKNVQ